MQCRGEPLSFSLGSLLGALSREGETKRGLDAGGFGGVGRGGRWYGWKGEHLKEQRN